MAVRAGRSSGAASAAEERALPCAGEGIPWDDEADVEAGGRVGAGPGVGDGPARSSSSGSRTPMTASPGTNVRARARTCAAPAVDSSRTIASRTWSPPRPVQNASSWARSTGESVSRSSAAAIRRRALSTSCGVTEAAASASDAKTVGGISSGERPSFGEA